MRHLQLKTNYTEEYRRTHRQLFMVFILFVSMVTIFPVSVYSQNLYIFLPTDKSSVKLESQLSDYFSGITLIVFGNITDFKSMVKNKKPEAIITKRPVVDMFEDYSIKMNASLKGSTDEPYFLVSIGQSIPLSDAAEKRIGILNFLGRREIKTFAADILGLKPKEISPVKKVSDLLALISLDMVQEIVISQTHYQYLKTTSKLDFKETECKKRVNIAVYAINKDNATLTEKVKKMPRELMALFGFDSWK